jgi:hypothetical protein
MDNPYIGDFLKCQKQEIKAMNKELGTDYTGYLDYLEANIGDDASFTIDELKALLKPAFYVKLAEREKKEWNGDFTISVDGLEKPVYIKDEGDFFTVWNKQGRVDVPRRLLNKFKRFLRDNRIEYEDNESILEEKGTLYEGELRGYFSKEDVEREIAKLEKR